MAAPRRNVFLLFRSASHLAFRVGKPSRFQLALQARSLLALSTDCHFSVAGSRSSLQQPLSRFRHVHYPWRHYCQTQLSDSVCWNCSSQRDFSDHHQLYFCPACYKVQPPHYRATHFELMNCEEVFEVDVNSLIQYYKNLQKQLHPDKYGNNPEREQSYSADQSALVNKAYNTLLKPFQRGLYMLELHGFSIEEGDSKVEPGFLMEVMEINEEIVDTQSIEEVKRIDQENSVKLQALLKELSSVFSQGDYRRAKDILVRMKYFVNIEEKVQERLSPHLHN